MKPFRDDPRPHWTPPPDCMSCDEIRWWIRELRRRGWNRGAMQKALGSRQHNWRKADGKEWIYPTEQLRWSRQLKRIIAGEIVMEETTRRSQRDQHFPGQRFQQRVVVAANPVPLTAPVRKAYSLKLGRLVDVPSYTPPQNPLPDFRKALSNLRYWDAKW